MITDEQGNKLPQPTIKKSTKSANERNRVAGQHNHCQCGYHIRSIGHNNGNQHRSWWVGLRKDVQKQYSQLEPTN